MIALPENAFPVNVIEGKQLLTCPDCDWPLICKRWYMGREEAWFCLFCFELVGPKETIQNLRLVVSN